MTSRLFVQLRDLALALGLTMLASAVWAQGSGASEGLTESLLRVRLARGAELTAMVSQRTGTAPKTAVLLFAGYPGVLRLREEGGAIQTDLNGNFLIRARRHLNTDQVFTVAVDCPSDQLYSCDDRYRTSAEHAADVAELIASVKSRFGAEKIYLAGTSYGTVSSSYLALAFGDSAAGVIDGAVHTATMTDPGRNHRLFGQTMGRFDWSRVKVPQLFIHHRDDPCFATSYASVVARRNGIPLITVQGAENLRGAPCEARSQHGFAGRERATMVALHDWVTQRKLSAVVGSE